MRIGQHPRALNRLLRDSCHAGLLATGHHRRGSA